MPSGPLLLGFIAASVVVLLIPGPGVLYVVARSAAQGYRAGLASVLGLSAGALVHVFAAAAGLSAILLTSATAFGLVKALGAAYLIYLGLRTVFASGTAAESGSLPPASARRLFIDGVMVSVFNPKIAVFFLAFLPQFVDPGAGPIAQQVLVSWAALCCAGVHDRRGLCASCRQRAALALRAYDARTGAAVCDRWAVYRTWRLYRPCRPEELRYTRSIASGHAFDQDPGFATDENASAHVGVWPTHRCAPDGRCWCLAQSQGHRLTVFQRASSRPAPNSANR